MKLKKVAKNAATEINNSIKAKLSKSEIEEIASIIAEAMGQAVNKATDRSIKLCVGHLNPNTDLAHQIQKDIKLKQDAIITNLNSLR